MRVHVWVPLFGEDSGSYTEGGLLQRLNLGLARYVFDSRSLNGVAAVESFRTGSACDDFPENEQGIDHTV